VCHYDCQSGGIGDFYGFVEEMTMQHMTQFLELK
jgi:hypothetical protein